MSVQTRIQRTSRFIDPCPYIAMGATVLVFLALVGAQLFQKTLVSTTLNVNEEEEPVRLQPIQLGHQPLGAVRIDVKALIPDNQWLTYEIQLLDRQGKVIASAIKQAWRESGAWAEEGEFGTWSEEDLLAGLDIRAQHNEEATVAIAVLDYGETSGRAINDSVQFEVTVQNGVVDTRYLWAGLVGAGSLAAIAALATPLTGVKAIAETINDSDPSERVTVGGSDSLVRVKVDIASDKTSPRQLYVRLWLNNAYGEQIYANSFPVKLDFKKEEGKIEGATGKLQAFFILEPRSSYSFHVQVTPDAPVDRTTLTVRDRNRTLRSVEVVQISPSPQTPSNSPQDRRAIDAD